MPSTIFTTPGRFGADVTRFYKELVEADAVAAERAMRRAAQEAKRHVIDMIDQTLPHPPVDTGKMRGGYDVRNVPGGAVLENRTPQAAFMEFGTKPHWAPFPAILAWVKRKRFTTRGNAAALARAIQRKIARVGTRPRRFHARASPAFPGFVRHALLVELSRVAARNFKRLS